MTDEEEDADTRRRFLAGLCPCCCGDIIPWPGPDGIDYEPEPVAEGVMLCGRCIGNEHHLGELSVVPHILRALVKGA